MVKQEFINFLTANNWVRVNNDIFRDEYLSVEIYGENVKMYRKNSNFCIFDFLLKDATCTSESTLTVKKNGKEYRVPFKKDGL